ncbi:MAG: SpoIIE family protein phosphatase [Candidatus Rifleibacteriota bacterium]
MSLQRRLTKGISVVLGVIVIFMALTSMSYFDIDSFVTTVLPRNVSIARIYQRFADQWNNTHKQAENDYSDYSSITSEKYKKDLENLDGLLLRLENLVKRKERKQQLYTIQNFCGSFSAQLDSYYLLRANRNRISHKQIRERHKAAQGLKSEVVSLLNRFKRMLQDFNSTLKNPDFQESLGRTSSLMEKITRIEKDLLLAESEIALYLSQKDSDNSASFDPNSGKKAASRVENRLRAIIFLLEKSLKESSTPLHKRVISKVKGRILDFHRSFQNLRNILEAPAGDLMEIEDKLKNKLTKLETLSQKAVSKANEESEFYWKQIFAISDKIKSHAASNHKLILAFLVLVLLAGIYLNISIPAKIGGPLKELNRQIENFKLGDHISLISKSNTEEIDSLARAFQMMSEKLNKQADVNRSYLESIHSLAQVYRDLHQMKASKVNPQERLEKAVDFILDQLITKCPHIDLLKVMVKKEKIINPEKQDKLIYYKRLGDPEFSENFCKSPEFIPYCRSVGWNPDDSSQSDEEIIPFDEGLTGYFYDDSTGIKTASDENSFYQAVYSPVKLNDLPTLTKRKYEKALSGSLFTEPLNLPVQDVEEDQKQLGMLFIYFVDPEVKLSWQDIFFIQIIASQLASIIETDNLLYERDIKRILDDQLDMAKEIQENLLPQSIPKVTNLKISKICKSAAEVGGDFYDFFVLDKNRFGVVIADASGKNVPAAIIMTVFKTTLSTMQLEKLNPAQVLNRANQVIARNITPDRFITAMYVIINSETGEVELSSAGHNPAFVVSGRGMELSLHEKNVSCMPLGILDNYEYENIKFKMKSNDMLFLYTDGVTEARNADEEEFGTGLLKKFLARPRPSNPAKALEEVLKKFSENADQHDDITAVSIEFKGKNNGK